MGSTITRRRFLAQSAALVSAGFVRTQATPHVLILGAGLSGLVAGYALKEAGIGFSILDARLRPGGRVETIREGFAEGLYAEAGPIFVHADHELTMGYCHEFGIALDPLPSRYVTGEYFARGKRISAPEAIDSPWPHAISAEERRLGLSGMLQKYMGAPANTIGDYQSANWPSREALRFDAFSLKKLLVEQGATEEACALLRLGYLDLSGDGPDSVSALFILRDWLSEVSSTASFAIRGGTDQLPHAFAARLSGHIQYGTVVERIEQTPAGVRVRFNRAGQSATATGTHALCTLPFSVAKGLSYSPDLTPEKRRAMAELAYTAVTRVFIQTSDRAWADNFGGTLSTDLSPMWVRDATVNQAGQRGIVESYMAGKQARKSAALSPGQRIAETAKSLDPIFPGLRQRVEGGCSKVWDDDPFARGGYCYYKPGQMASLWPHVATPEGRLFFAGEHTSAWPGWMQGALSSGLRAVDEIRKALGV